MQNLYEIAHIYPLNATHEQKLILQNEERLGADLNDEDNLIPLCRNCHAQFDKPRTVEGYRKLIAIKKKVLERSRQAELWGKNDLEDSILVVIDAIYADHQEGADAEISFEPMKLDQKLTDTMSNPTKGKIKSNVSRYFTLIRERMSLLDKHGDCISEIISNQIKGYYLQQKRGGSSQQAAFDNIVKWINVKTEASSSDAGEIIASFFIQNCEIFD